MKIHRSIIIATVIAAIAAMPIPAFAGKKKKKNKGEPSAAASVLSQFDANKDGKISGDESEGLRKAFAGSDATKLKQFDTNNDGKLDDNEIAAIKDDGGKKKRKKKKNK